MKNRSWPVAIFAAAIAAIVAAFDASATTFTWTGTGGTNNWTDSGNWGGTAPSAGDDLAFPAGPTNKSANNDFAAGTSFNSITVSDVGYTLGGNPIALAAGNALTFAALATGNIAYNLPTTFNHAAAAMALSGVVSVGQVITVGGALTIAGGSLAVTVDGNIAELRVNGSIGESGPSASISKAGEGILQLNAANTYTGTTTVNAGYFYAFHSNALGTGTNVAADGTVVNIGGTLRLGNVTIANEALVLNGTGQSNNGTLQAGDTSAWNGTVTLGSFAPKFVISGALKPLTLNGKVTGASGFTFGRGMLILTNPLNDWIGGITIGNPSSGAHVLKLGASNVIPDGTSVNVIDSGTFDLNNFTEAIASLTGTAGTTVALGTGRLDTQSSGSTAFAGSFQGSAAASLNLLGTGTMTLSGVSPLAGSTQVSFGKLLVNAGASLANSAITVVDNGILGGGGSVGAVAGYLLGPVANGGKVSPGASPGALTAAALTLTSKDTFVVELNGATAGTQYDQLIVNGQVTLTGTPTLSVSLGYAPAINQTFKIIDNNGAAVIGTFDGLPEGGTFNVAGPGGPYQLQISYVGGDGNDVVLTVKQVVVCTYALAPPDLSNQPAAGATPIVTVTTPALCPVTATSFQPWVIIGAITPAGGTTTVSLTISANAGAARATSIRVADRLYLVTQQGQ